MRVGKSQARWLNRADRKKAIRKTEKLIATINRKNKSQSKLVFGTPTKENQV
jgi:hypothetical protein